MNILGNILLLLFWFSSISLLGANKGQDLTTCKCFLNRPSALDGCLYHQISFNVYG